MSVGDCVAPPWPRRAHPQHDGALAPLHRVVGARSGLGIAHLSARLATHGPAQRRLRVAIDGEARWLCLPLRVTRAMRPLWLVAPAAPAALNA